MKKLWLWQHTMVVGVQLFCIMSNYVENSDKTDQTMYVSGINCTKKQAYEQMMTTKRRFGKLGGNVPRHGREAPEYEKVS